MGPLAMGALVVLCPLERLRPKLLAQPMAQLMVGAVMAVKRLAKPL
jgi:hypothetical protein